MTMPPCIRHGEKGTEDARLLRALQTAASESGQPVEAELELLTDFGGQLWASWRSPQSRDLHGPSLTRAWAQVGGEGGALHLVRSEENFDYQEDCMNDAG